MWIVFYLFFNVYHFLCFHFLLKQRTNKQWLVYQQWHAYHRLKSHALGNGDRVGRQNVPKRQKAGRLWRQHFTELTTKYIVTITSVIFRKCAKHERQWWIVHRAAACQVSSTSWLAQLCRKFISPWRFTTFQLASSNLSLKEIKLRSQWLTRTQYWDSMHSHRPSHPWPTSSRLLTLLHSLPFANLQQSCSYCLFPNTSIYYF